MRKGKRVTVLWVVALSLLAGGAAAETGENGACFACHGERGVSLTFQNGETLEVFIDPAKFQVSMHGSQSCSTCHPEFSAQNHPDRKFKSKEQYSRLASAVCSHCHADEQLKKVPVHASLLDKENKAPVCASCHNPHTVTAVTGGKRSASEREYCLGCHNPHTVTAAWPTTIAASMPLLLLSASMLSDFPVSSSFLSGKSPPCVS